MFHHLPIAILAAVADVYSNPELDRWPRLFGDSFGHFLLRTNVSR